MPPKERRDEMWSYDRRYLVASLWIAALVWVELCVLAIVAHSVELSSASSLSPSDRYGLRVVSLGWPLIYGLSLGMVYVIGNLQQAAAADNNTRPRAARAASMMLNGVIVMYPGCVAAAVNFGLLAELLFSAP